jgi:acetyl-CoA acetyltransferase
VSQLLEKQQMNASDIDTFELNEAFAAQSIACINELGIDQDRVNPNGGAIALGHPVGASGSRILVTLIYDLLHSDAQTGVASLCIGGGMGAATLIKKTTNQ